MSKRPVVYGEVLYDCFEDGSRVLGGAPFNVAWHLSAFGAEPLFISRVGDDAMGRQIRDTMQQWGMSTAGLQLDSAYQTGEVRVTLQNGQPSYEIVADRAYDHISSKGIPPIDPALIYHGSLGLRASGSAETLAGILADSPAPVFLDINLRPPWWSESQVKGLLDKATWVKLNDDELVALLPGDGGLENRAGVLMDRHRLSRLIVTQGADGAFAIDRSEGRVQIRTERSVEIVDTVGAGDGFTAVCLLGQLHGWPVGQTIERAHAFAALLVQQRGALLHDRAPYRQLIEDWQPVG